MNRGRRKYIAILLGIGALLTAILFALVEFSLETPPLAKGLMIVFIWLFISYGLRMVADLLSTVRDLLTISKGRSPQSGLTSVEDIAASKELEADDAVALSTMVAAMARHGIFAPEVPDPTLLHPGIADFGEVSPAGVFEALGELHHYHPDIPEDAFAANLAMLSSHGEQGVEALAGEIADFDRLTHGALGLADEAIHWPANVRTSEAELRITMNGEPTVLRWRALDKYLSTVPHVALARAYAALGTGYRLATYWTDRGAWVMRLADGAVEALNVELALDPATSNTFGWLDKEQPMAAGDPPPRPI
jgi:hypothetical protein